MCYAVLPYAFVAFDELFHREGSIVVVVSPEFMSLMTSLMVDHVS